MNPGEAIGLLVGLADPPSDTEPLLLQEWDWAEAVVSAVEKANCGYPELRDLLVEAIDQLLDLPISKPGDAHEEVIRRRAFNEIRKGARRE